MGVGEAGRRRVRAGPKRPAWRAALCPPSYFGEYGPRFTAGRSAPTYPTAAGLPFLLGTRLAAAMALTLFGVARKVAYRTVEPDRATAPGGPAAQPPELDSSPSDGQRGPLSRRPRSME